MGVFGILCRPVERQLLEPLGWHREFRQPGKLTQRLETAPARRLAKLVEQVVACMLSGVADIRCVRLAIIVPDVLLETNRAKRSFDQLRQYIEWQLRGFAVSPVEGIVKQVG